MRRALVVVSTTLFFLPASAKDPVPFAESFAVFYAEENASALVTCEAIRSHGVVGGGELSFSCGVLGAGLSGVFWQVKPEHCCSRTERYRVTEHEQDRQNADVQLLLRPTEPVRGTVLAVVVDASGQQELLESLMDFVVAPPNKTHECHCTRRNMTCGADGSCRCAKTSLHYDPVHGVCFSAVPLGGTCRYHHQCQHSDTNLECIKGRCDCGYGAVPGNGSCLQAARYGERCSSRSFCVVGYCGRGGRCVCRDGQRLVRGKCVGPDPAPSQPRRRSILDANRHLLKLPFVAVCVVLLVAACVARTTTRAAGWFLWRRREPDTSSERRNAVREPAYVQQQQTATLYPSRSGHILGPHRRKASVQAAL